MIECLRRVYSFSEVSGGRVEVATHNTSVPFEVNTWSTSPCVDSNDTVYNPATDLPSPAFLHLPSSILNIILHPNSSHPLPRSTILDIVRCFTAFPIRPKILVLILNIGASLWQTQGVSCKNSNTLLYTIKAWSVNTEPRFLDQC